MNSAGNIRAKKLYPEENYKIRDDFKMPIFPKKKVWRHSIYRYKNSQIKNSYIIQA
jgi:hypothetical protein